MSFDIGIAFANLSNHALQCLARTTFSEVGCTVSHHIVYFLRPKYRSGELSDEVGLDFFRVGVRLSVNVLVNGADGFVELCIGNSSFKFFLSRLH